MRSVTWWARRKLLRWGVNATNTTSKPQLEEFFSLFRLKDSPKPLIRVGGAADGGYVIPDVLDAVDFLFSPGIGSEFGFDIALARTGVSCRLLESNKEILMRAQKAWPSVEVSSDVRFRLGALGTDDGPEQISLESWVAMEAPQMSSGCLQMDIEGDEYLTLLQASPGVLKKFELIVIEFHNLERLLDPYTFPFIYKSFNKLFRYFDLVHIRPNHNGPPHQTGDFVVPRQVELTLLRQNPDRPLLDSEKTLPTELDHEAYLYPPGNPRFELGFPTHWYRT